MTNINDIGSLNYIITKMSIFSCSLLHVITPPTHSSHHAYTFSLSIALLASSSESWIIDLGTSAHMSSIQSLLPCLSKLSRWLCLSFCGTWRGQSDFLTPIISSPIRSQFPYQPLIYQCHHQSLIFLSLSLSHYFLTIVPFRICGWGIDWFGA